MGIEDMLNEQLVGRGIQNRRILEAMRTVDRALFVPVDLQSEAYADTALPVGYGQTISQPYIVGLMTELLDPQKGDHVLEIGCGTGYQAAVLAELAEEVWTLEIIPELASLARARMAELEYRNVYVLAGDGYVGLAEQAPFDKIIITAAPKNVPVRLLEQLSQGGRMVVPIGTEEQELMIYERVGLHEYKKEHVAPVRFVPMVHGRSSF